MGLLGSGSGGGGFSSSLGTSRGGSSARSPRIGAPRRLGQGAFSGFGGGGITSNYQPQSPPPAGYMGSTGPTYGNAGGYLGTNPASPTYGPGISPSSSPPSTPSTSAPRPALQGGAYLTTYNPATGRYEADNPMTPVAARVQAGIESRWEQQRNQQGIDLANADISAQLGPQGATLQSRLDQLMAQQGLTEANYANQQGLARNASALQQQLLASQRGGIGVDLAAIARQMGYYGELGALNEQSIGLQRQGAWQGADQDQRGAKSDAIARGAMGAPGIDRTLNDIESNLRRQLQGFDVDSTTNRVNTAEQQARLQDRRAQLDIESSRLGIQSDQLATALEQQLASLGLDQIMSVGSLLDARNSNILQQQQLADQIIQYTLQNAGFYTPAPTGPGYRTNANTGGGAGGTYRS